LGDKSLNNFIQVSTTFSKLEDAEKAGEELVKNRLCSCTQIIGPIKSIYWWDNKINYESEWLCLSKTTKNKFKEIEKTIKKIHLYETPEIICTEIKSGSKEYLEWIIKETKFNKSGII